MKKNQWKKDFNGTSSNLSSKNVGHSLLQCTAGIWLWCVYDVQVERERRSDTGTVTTPITEMKSCWESHHFSYTPITWLSCMAIVNHETDHDPLMETLNYWQVGLSCFLILLFCAQWYKEWTEMIFYFSQMWYAMGSEAHQIKLWLRT